MSDEVGSKSLALPRCHDIVEASLYWRPGLPGWQKKPPLKRNLEKTDDLWMDLFFATSDIPSLYDYRAQRMWRWRQ
jgi:hypothetical protein